ncbi:hypothetical protein [Kordiimonas aquimaris]|uniref:hypothetical protein n=1 Tax=Kordiimonas aquimaris TaxID=707591 RepID=UPI0021CE9213|nr:hypothetical protein [Kordiimonas aquimaris]
MEMDGKVFVLLIIAMVGLFSWLERNQKNRAKMAKASSDKMDAGHQKEIEQLKERVAVLERILTDKRERLKDEIDSL